MWTAAPPLSLTPDQRAILQRWARGRRTPQRVTLRARIVLAAAEGLPNHRIAQELQVSRPTVLLWRERFATQGADGLRQDAPRPGRPPQVSAAKIDAVIKATLHTTPSNATHWSVRTMARAQGLSRMTIQRIWNAHQLKPHLVETFKFSTDRQFVEKLRDVVGLYFSPPDRALVLSVDEKSQIQALDRTQPLLPLRPGIPARQTHDYRRHGTTTLFTALNILDGHVIGRVPPPPSASGVLEIPPAARRRDIPRPGAPPDRGQLRGPISTPRCAAGWHAIREYICTSRRRGPRGSIWWSAGCAS